MFLCMPAISAEYENPVVFSAKKILPSELMENDAYDVHDEVRNDGFMNIYNVESRFGNWEISSTAILRPMWRPDSASFITPSRMRIRGLVNPWMT